ncbi:MAG TPA: HEAT repeat domain-containing protein, partial [Armatimonadetes bacterium]|nr:HEAT repeat domain-containing protein [Armatimonadota bacterium]
MAAASKKQVQRLIARLRAKGEEERSAVIAELVALGEVAVEPLIAALQDTAYQTRMAAAQALGQIGSEQALRPLLATLNDASVNVQRAGVEALTRMGTPAVEPLVALLQDKDAKTRRRAAETLGRIQAPEAVEALVKALSDENAE